MNKSFINGVGISKIDYEDIAAQIKRSILENKQCTITYVNHHIYNLCRNNMLFRNTINNSTLSHADGVGIWLAGKLLGADTPRFNWTDHSLNFLEMCEREEWTLFFYGSTEQMLSKVKTRLKELFPNLKVNGSISGYTDLDCTLLIQIINDSNSDILWVGLGSPKQELWIGENCNKLNVKIIQSVGDIFTYLADRKVRGPKIIQQLGFEWLFRLFANPQRMWRRYVIGIPYFIAQVLYLFVTGKNEK